MATRRSAAETREHVLGVAHEIFYWRGIHSSGIDSVAKAADVAPVTLYRQFASKDDLVAAYVRQTDTEYRQWFQDAVVGAGDDSRSQILAVFDALAVQVEPTNSRGCPFVMTLAEYPEVDSSAHECAVEQKVWLQSALRDLAAKFLDGRDGSAELGDQLTLVMEGVYASVASRGNLGPASAARGLVERLLDWSAPTR